MAAPDRPTSNRLAEWLDVLRANLPELRDRYGIRSLAAFGSHVRGEQKHGSDLDLLVEFDGTPTLLEFVAVELAIAELLGTKIDLVMKSALKPNVGRRVLEEALPV